jgi:DNA-binding response OmpR family regulator
MIANHSNPDPIQNRLCIIGEADPFLTLLVKRIAGKSGFKTKHAKTGEAMLNLVYQEKPALIVLEPDLPGKVRGWEAAQLLQKDAVTSRISIIFFSWLKKDDVQTLVGWEITHLLKPDLDYQTFAAALVLAGVQTLPR